MQSKQYFINELVALGKRDKEAAEFVRHCSPTTIGRDVALAHLRHIYGYTKVYLSMRAGQQDTIVVAGLFTATPVDSQVPFPRTGTLNPFQP